MQNFLKFTVTTLPGAETNRLISVLVRSEDRLLYVLIRSETEVYFFTIT